LVCGFSQNVAMKRTLALLLTVVLLLSTAHRLPAPIQEVSETPTPAPEQKEKPRPKRTVKPKAGEGSESSTKAKTSSPTRKNHATAKPERFAGSWNGTINRGSAGNVNYTLVVNATGTSVKEISTYGAYDRPASWDGYAVRFCVGWSCEVACTLTPDNEGKTARVTMIGFMQNGDSVFRRTSP
jgi:hypothetical protein